MINHSQTQHITNILTNLTLPEYDKNEDEVLNNNTKIRWWGYNQLLKLKKFLRNKKETI